MKQKAPKTQPPDLKAYEASLTTQMKGHEDRIRELQQIVQSAQQEAGQIVGQMNSIAGELKAVRKMQGLPDAA